MNLRTLPLRLVLTATAVAALLHTPPVTGAADPPDTVVIETLRQRYAEVTFDHSMHADYAACTECHHHTTGDPPTEPLCSRCHTAGNETTSVACASCHPAQPFASERITWQAVDTSYHIDIPGLQGAYHLNCIPCHEAIDGPTGCLDCHQRQP